MTSTHGPKVAPIQRLPFELKEQIARELCDFDLFDQGNYRIDPSGDTFLNGHTYEWNPLPEAREKPQLSFQSVYDDLRALSLVSRDFRDPAQRALFAVVIVGDPTAYFKLLRSLLESPEVRPYIRCLFAISVRNPDVEKRRHEIVTSRLAAFVEILGRLVVRKGCLGLFNQPILLHGRSVFSSAHRNESYMFASRDFPGIVTEVVTSILRLCPSLRAFHLHCSHWPSGTQEDPWAFWSHPVGCHQWIGVLNGDPLLTTLTIDVRAVEGFYCFTYKKPHSCPSTIEHLTLIGSTTLEHSRNLLDIDFVFPWVSAISRLKTLRLENGFDNDAWSKTHNWNTILLKFKATLEELVVGGTALLLHMLPSDIIGAHSQAKRLGPTCVLSCLPEMKKLRYLSVPIHYLRRCPEDKEELEILMMPNEGQNVLQVVQADVKFPKSLERAEVMVVEQVEFTFYRRITGVKALRIDLSDGDHITDRY